MLSEFPVVTVHIPPNLRQFADGHEEVMASGETVGDILQAIGREYPAFHSRLIGSDGSLAAGLAVYLGSTSIGQLLGLATPVLQEELVSLVSTG